MDTLVGKNLQGWGKLGMRKPQNSKTISLSRMSERLADTVQVGPTTEEREEEEMTGNKKIGQKEPRKGKKTMGLH